MENDKLSRVIKTIERFLHLPTIPFQKATPNYLIRKVWSINFPLFAGIIILNILTLLGISIKSGSFEPVFASTGLGLGYLALMVCWYYVGRLLPDNMWPRTRIHLPEALVRFNAYFLSFLAIFSFFAGIIASIRLSSPAILMVSLAVAIIFIQWVTILLNPSIAGIELNKGSPPSGYLIILEWSYLKTGMFYITFLELFPACLILILIFILTQGIGLFGLTSGEVLLRYKSIIMIQGIIPLIVIVTVVIYILLQTLGAIAELINRFVTKTN